MHLGRALTVLLVAAGCHSTRPEVAPCAADHVESLALAKAPPFAFSPAAPAPEFAGPLSLPWLWGIALARNPALWEAGADVEAARGRLVQAGLYPNPRLTYDQDTIGSRIARQGNFTLRLSQEIFTGGKLKLDVAVADRETAAAAAGLVSRKFEVLTRVRRGYYDYLALRALLALNGETVALLERGAAVTRRQVEEAKTRPLTDLLRVEALLEEARTNQARARDALQGAWRQLAAEVGVPDLPCPAEAPTLPEAAPATEDDAVLRRVLTSNSALLQAAVEAERAALAVQRARAAAVPNVTVGAGWNADNTDQTAGGVVGVETAIPVWNRQQGAIREAEARLAGALAAVRGVESRLAREVADALARYKAARRQVEQLAGAVLPRLQRSLELLLKAYEAGSAQVSFADVLTTEQNINATRLTLAEARRSLWQALADLQGLLQVDVGEETAILSGTAPERTLELAPPPAGEGTAPCPAPEGNSPQVRR
jgi:cobalt-zinc-cadmium efflux system outer membrane protein